MADNNEQVIENDRGEDEENLNQELTEKLIHFQEITNIDDLNRCKTILRQHDWNVESAVQSTFLEAGMSNSQQSNLPPSISANSGLRRRNVATISPPLPLRTNSHTTLYEARGLQLRQPQGIFEWGYYVLSMPFRFTWSTLFGIVRFFMRLFLPDTRARLTDPLGDVTSFITEYEELYGERHPVFFQGSYADAQNECRRQMQFLLVYLHGPDHQDTPDFCNNTLANDDVIQLVQRNFVFWSCSVNKPEGYRVSRAMRENTYPFLAIICQYQGKMTVVGRLEGPLTSQELMEQASAIIERFEPTMIAARAERAERDMTQQIRSEQDAAYEQSLQQDKEKEKKKLEEEESKKKKEQELLDKEKMKEEAENRYLQRKQECKKALSTEPDPSHSEAVKLLIKLPDGSRLTRVFLSSQPVKAIHDFVFSQDNAPRQFQVGTNFPRKIIPGCSTSEVLEHEEIMSSHTKPKTIDDEDEPRNTQLTISDVELKSCEMLFVQSIDDTDDEDSDR
ncbi:FAS-associated factor 2-like [Styela clava]|uniref:FAS-associated factor 2-like n=1 Tax=Styela clava TaxID=7725 RepID=UPI00193A844C|nr:FAS-associated factor 2-like [Styela clava]